MKKALAVLGLCAVVAFSLTLMAADVPQGGGGQGGTYMKDATVDKVVGEMKKGLKTHRG